MQYEISGEPAKFYHCHCQRCRKATGTGHASNLFLQPGSINWLKGEELIRLYKVPEAKRFSNCFCTNCGSRVPRYAKEVDAVIIPAGSLDSEPTIARRRVSSGIHARAGLAAATTCPPIPNIRPERSRGRTTV